jgi:hypothetical protein
LREQRPRIQTSRVPWATVRCVTMSERDLTTRSTGRGDAPCWIVVPLRGETAQHRAKPCPLICPPRPSGNMPAAPGQIPPRRSATAWEAPRRTSTVRVRTTVLPKGRSCGKRHPSAATAAKPGDCTTCSAPSGSGAATATHQDSRAASIPGGHPQRPREFSGVDAGTIPARASVPAGRGTGALRRLSVAPGSASAWRLSVPIPERCSQSDNPESRFPPAEGDSPSQIPNSSERFPPCQPLTLASGMCSPVLEKIFLKSCNQPC